jgi:hypothetical protein
VSWKVRRRAKRRREEWRACRSARPGGRRSGGPFDAVPTRIAILRVGPRALPPPAFGCDKARCRERARPAIVQPARPATRGVAPDEDGGPGDVSAHHVGQIGKRRAPVHRRPSSALGRGVYSALEVRQVYLIAALIHEALEGRQECFHVMVFPVENEPSSDAALDLERIVGTGPASKPRNPAPVRFGEHDPRLADYLRNVPLVVVDAFTVARGLSPQCSSPYCYGSWPPPAHGHGRRSCRCR